MTDDAPFTHQLGRFAKECAPRLLEWFPELKNANLDGLDSLLETCKDGEEAVGLWLTACVAICGMKLEYDVPKIAGHVVINPVEELASMIGKDKIAVVHAEAPAA